MRLCHINVSFKQYYNAFIFEGLKSISQGPRKKPQFEFDFQNDDLNDINTILLLKNPAAVKPQTIQGYKVYAAFTGLQRREDAEQQTQAAREAKQQARAVGKTVKVTEADVLKVKNEAEIIVNYLNQGRYVSAIVAIAKYPTIKLPDAPPQLANMIENSKGVASNLRDDLEEANNYTTVTTPSGAVSEYMDRQLSSIATKLIARQKDQMIDTVTQIATMVDEMAKQSALAIQAAAGQQQQATAQSAGAKQLVDNTRTAFRHLGDYVIQNLSSPDIQQFIALAVKLLTDAIGNIGLVIPVPSRGGINPFVKEVCERIRSQANADYVEGIKREPFSFDKNIYADLIRKRLSKVKSGSQKFEDMNTILQGIQDDSFLDLLLGQYVGNWQDSNKTIGQIIDKVTDKTKPGSISSINIDYRGAFKGGYTIDSSDILETALITCADKNQKVVLVDDNLYSGTTMALNLEIIHDVAQGLLNTQNLVGCVVVSPG